MASVHGAPAAAGAPLTIEAKITLGNVHGRLDHLAVDLKRQRLYVAELADDAIAVVDLKPRRSLRTLAGLAEPQGIGYEATTDTLYVANGRDGSVRLFNGSDLASVGRIALGDDADNVRIDAGTHRVWVGYGKGSLAALDPVRRQQVAVVPLRAHPEGFVLERAGSRIFVNVPEAAEIAVLDRTANRQTAAWKTNELHANFPLALDDAGLVLAVFRHPAKLAAFRSQDGSLLQTLVTCGDSDDLFVDSLRHRVYVSCGEGYIEVFSRGESAGYHSAGRLATASGARTSLFVPELDRLFLAVRATPTAPASIWVIRPEP